MNGPFLRHEENKVLTNFILSQKVNPVYFQIRTFRLQLQKDAEQKSTAKKARLAP